MKLKQVFACIMLFSVLMSCKDEEKKGTEPVATEVETNENFVVTMNAVIKKDDSFQLYYKDAEAGNYEETKSVFTEVKGSDQAQDVVFTMPEDVLPNFFRLDFGTNKTQSPIVINSVKFQYLDKDFVLSNSTFFDYFILNDLTIKADRSTSTLTPILMEGGNYDPMTYSGLILAEEIKKLKQ